MNYNTPKLTRKANKFLVKQKKINNDLYKRLYLKIKDIHKNPSKFDYIVDSPNFQKARVGKYRIIFLVENKDIIILDINHRKNIYKKI